MWTTGEKTRVPGVFYSEKISELTTGNLKITMELFISSIIDNYIMDIRTLQCEIQQLKIQTMIEISKNV